MGLEITRRDPAQLEESCFLINPIVLRSAFRSPPLLICWVHSGHCARLNLMKGSEKVFLSVETCPLSYLYWMTLQSFCNQSLPRVRRSLPGSNSGSSTLLEFASLVCLAPSELNICFHLQPVKHAEVSQHVCQSLIHSNAVCRDTCFHAEAAAVCAIFGA